MAAALPLPVSVEVRDAAQAPSPGRGLGGARAEDRMAVERVAIGGREVRVIVDKSGGLDINVPEYVKSYVRAIPPLGLTWRGGEYLRDETPYFTVSVFEKPPIKMKPPYNIDYTDFWRKYRVLRLKPEERWQYRVLDVVEYVDEDEWSPPPWFTGQEIFRPHWERVAATAFLFVEGLTRRDGVEVLTSVCNVVVPFDVFKAWLELEKSCSWLSPRAVARRMPAPLKGYLILYLNDEYQSIDIVRSTTPRIEDAFDSCFVELDPQTYERLKKAVERLDATTAFVEILKTAIKHAEDHRLADITRLLNH
jgi:hypothetical protein